MSIQQILFSLAACALMAASSACTPPKPSSPAAASAGTGKVLNLFSWSNYVSPETLENFKKLTGIEVRVSTYSSNEELVAKLQAGASGYDVAIPSDYMVSSMIKLGLITKFDYAKLPNAKELDPSLLKKPYDPGNEYSLPYDWGSTGLAVNRNFYKGAIAGWKAVFESPELAGHIMLLDDVRETMAAALKYLGYSLNTRKPEELAKAKEVLIKVKKRIKGFNSEPQESLIQGEVWVAHSYSSDALRGRKRVNGQIDYLFPAEGCTVWIDNLVIPKGAQHVEEAHAFINFLLSASANVSLVANIFVVPSNRTAISLLPLDLQKNPMVFPPKEKLQKCEMLEDLGEAMPLWDRAWTEVKVAGN